MTNSPDVVVVGAGIAGLFAANLLVQRGCSVHVVEHNHQPGGCLNGIWRKGFYFDAGDQSFEQVGVVFPLLKDIGAADRVEFERTWYRLVTPDVDIQITADDSLRRGFTEAFPEAAQDFHAMFDELQTYIRLLRRWLSEEHHPLYGDGWKRALRLARLAPEVLANWQTAKAMFSRSAFDLTRDHLQDPALREFWARVGYKNMALMVFAGFMYCWVDDYWYPRGGLQAFCDTLADHATQRGALFEYKTTVERVLLEDNRAVGVLLADGRAIRAGRVLYCGDAGRLARDLLPREAVDPHWATRSTEGKASEALTSVYLGIDMPQDALRECLQTHHTFYFPDYTPHDPDTLDDPDLHAESWLEFSAPCLTDDSLAPEGQSALVLQTMAHANWHERWQRNGAEGKSAYRALKRTVTDQMCRTAEGLVPDLRDRIVWSDVGTPVSAERFTMNTNGASAGWTFDPYESVLNGKFLNIHTPVRDLYTAGHWSLWPGGVPAAALSAKFAADAITSRGMRTALSVADRLTGALR